MNDAHDPLSALLGKRIYTPGPVKMSARTLALGQVQTPYFRNRPFSELVLACETWLLALANAPAGSRVVFLTASGTAAMEAVVMQLLSPDAPVAVINGGTFGQRFVDLCRLHGLAVQDIGVDRDPLSDGHWQAQVQGAQALLVNGHETSVGHVYDLEATGQFCAKQDMLHVVDAISLFVTDRVDMQAQQIDALILSSHKGLALPPGLAMVVLAPRALARVRPAGVSYLDFAAHLRDGARGQTPFTPAVSVFVQLYDRLQGLMAQGKAQVWQETARLAAHFRQGLEGLPMHPYARCMPNAMTAVQVAPHLSALELVQRLEQEHGCVVAPNGGALAEQVFRVSHMGDMQVEDLAFLLQAIRAVVEDGV